MNTKTVNNLQYKKKEEPKIYEEYFKFHKKYKKKYGEKSLVLMQVGGFFEAYATDDKDLNHGNLPELLNINVTRKNKKYSMDAKSNPYMMGFPTAAIPKFLEILKNYGYTVIIIEQIGTVEGSKKKERKITEITSNGTSLDNKSPDANNMLCIYVEDIQQPSSKFDFCIGLSVVDISTGNSTVHETYSKNNDERFSLDEASIFINHYNPKEIIIYRKTYGDENKAMSEDKLINYLEINDRSYHYYTELPSKTEKISYQKDFLQKLFKDNNMVDIFEYLEIDDLQYARQSYILVLQFAYEHNEDIVKFLFKPEIYSQSQNLILGNGAIYQLNVTENKLNETPNGKHNSLLSVVNKTSTAIGKRFLVNALNFPLINTRAIYNRYLDIEAFRNSETINEVTILLKQIIDIERFQRKLFLGKLHPYQFASLVESYTSVMEIVDILKNNKELKRLLPDKKLIMLLKKFLNEVNETVNIEKMKKYNLGSIEESFFINNKVPHLDKIQKEMNTNFNFLNNIVNYLSLLIPKGPKSNPETIKLQRNDRDGYYMILTKKRSELLKETIKTKKDLKIGEVTVDINDFTFRPNPSGASVKLYSKQLSERSNNLVELRDKIIKLADKEYLKFMKSLHTKFKSMYQKLARFIGYLDFIKCGAVVSLQNNYIKPEIVDGVDNGFVKVKQLRHPIVERINEEVEYIPNDLSIGRDKNNQNNNKCIEGMLIYGLNSAGKSTIMKALGLSVILAQIGYYVPAKEFVYHPYKAIYARITGNDNILKGLSSFALEMLEVRAILSRADKHTLVIGDEVCRGTEYVSGNAIVASTIIRLAQKHSSFIFATHLHEIPEIKEVKQLTNVKSYHIVVDYDEDNDNLIFERKLKEGSGPRIYGITVAKFLIHDNDFIRQAQSIKNNLLKQSKHILNDKVSKYNSNIFVDSCANCGKEMKKEDFYDTGLETHHINHQVECENGFVKSKPHLKMNSKANLVVICKECHYKVHHEGLDIKGYKDTAKGRELIIEEELNSHSLQSSNNLEIKIKKLLESKLSQKEIHKRIKKNNKNVSLSQVRKIIKTIKV